MVAKPMERAATPMLNAARNLLFSLLVAVPLANTVPQTWGGAQPFTADFFSAPKLLVFSLLLGFACVAWIVALLRGESPIRFPKHLGWLVAGFLGIGLLSAAFGIHPPTAFFGDEQQKQGVLLWLGYGLMWFLLVQTVSTRADASRAATYAIIGGFLVATYDLVQILWLGVERWPGVERWMAVRGVSTIGNPDQLGGYLVLPLVLAIAMAIGENTRWRQVAYSVATATLGTAVFLTQTRGAWLGVLVGIVVLAVAGRRGGVRLGRTGVTVLAAVAVGAAALSFVVRPRLALELAQRLQAWAGGSGGSGSGRLLMWRDALGIFGQHPLSGVGPDSYRLAWYGVRGADFVASAGFGSYVSEPHNLVLTIASTFGLAAVIVALAVFVTTLWRSKSALQGPLSSAEAVSLAGWWAATLAIATYALFGPSPIVITSTLWFALGILSAAAARRVQEPAALARGVAVMLSISIAAIVVWVGVATFAADVEMMASLRVIPNAVAHAQKASAYAPWSTQAKRWLAAAYVNQARAAYNAGSTGQAMNLARNAVGHYEAAIAFSPRDLDNYWEYADSLSSMGLGPAAGFPDVVEVSRRGLQQDPYAVGVAMYGAKSLYDDGRYQDAVEMLDSLWDIDPGVSSSGVLYARALAGTGDAAGAREVMTTLLRRFPDDDDVRALRSELASGAVAP